MGRWPTSPCPPLPLDDSLAGGPRDYRLEEEEAWPGPPWWAWCVGLTAAKEPWARALALQWVLSVPSAPQEERRVAPGRHGPAGGSGPERSRSGQGVGGHGGEVMPTSARITMQSSHWAT